MKILALMRLKTEQLGTGQSLSLQLWECRLINAKNCLHILQVSFRLQMIRCWWRRAIFLQAITEHDLSLQDEWCISAFKLLSIATFLSIELLFVLVVMIIFIDNYFLWREKVFRCSLLRRLNANGLFFFQRFVINISIRKYACFSQLDENMSL